MIEMAPATARRCEEKRAGRGLSPGQALRHGSLKPLRRPKDVVHLLNYGVAKDLKMGKHFLRLRSLYLRQMASHHFDQINRS